MVLMDITHGKKLAKNLQAALGSHGHAVKQLEMYPGSASAQSWVDTTRANIVTSADELREFLAGNNI